jgi:serine/threonine protein kinase
MPTPDTAPTTASPPLNRAPGSEPIPGYRLIERLGHGGSGEVWKCEAPGGLLKAIKFIHAGPLPDVPAQQERYALGRVTRVRHAFLLSLDRIEQVGPELVIVMELADRHLGHVLAEQSLAGRTGLPRDEVLRYLREAAEALDVLNREHGLQHLDVKPGNLFLVGRHVKVGDFGLVNRSDGGTSRPGAVTPLYAAPELFEGVVSPHSDQYSLAIVYQELLTGTLPFDGKNFRQLMVQHTRGLPNLAALPVADRPLVARALSQMPEQRFASCGDLIDALAGSSPVLANRVSAPAVQPTPPVAMPKPVPTLGDLRLVECVRRTPVSEVHRAQGPDGRERQVTILFVHTHREDLDRLAALQNPALAEMTALPAPRGGLALVTDPPGRTLRDRLRECTLEGLPGIPRAELLGHLRSAAVALDSLQQQHGVAHLGLNPRNLLLADGRLTLAEFGLAQLVWLPAGKEVARLNARYSAPELFSGQVGPACDQYSLALIYHELLTGALPDLARGKAALDALPTSDRAAVARALEPDPARRWPSCTDLIGALESTPAAPTDGDPAQAGAKREPPGGSGGSGKAF